MKKVDGFKTASERLLEEIKSRFSYILDPDHKQYEVIYAVATALDPRYSLALQDNQLVSAKEEILRLVSIIFFYNIIIYL